jgi:hypothetical protein
MGSMGRWASAFFYGMIGLFVLLAVIALIAGWWIYSIFSVVLAIGFVISAPFVLGKGWRPPPPKPTRRPVVRRRR